MVSMKNRTRPSLIVLLSQVIFAFLVIALPVSAQHEFGEAAPFRDSPAGKNLITPRRLRALKPAPATY
jgi:hypothetical protein